MEYFVCFIFGFIVGYYIKQTIKSHKNKRWDQPF